MLRHLSEGRCPRPSRRATAPGPARPQHRHPRDVEVIPKAGISIRHPLPRLRVDLANRQSAMPALRIDCRTGACPAAAARSKATGQSRAATPSSRSPNAARHLCGTVAWASDGQRRTPPKSTSQLVGTPLSPTGAQGRPLAGKLFIPTRTCASPRKSNESTRARSRCPAAPPERLCRCGRLDRKAPLPADTAVPL